MPPHRIGIPGAGAARFAGARELQRASSGTRLGGHALGRQCAAIVGLPGRPGAGTASRQLTARKRVRRPHVRSVRPSGLH